MTRARVTPLYRIQAVAHATGVSEHALRVWERRYGELASQRSPAGYRLYTDEDVARVRLIKELLERGHAIGEIAALPARDLERLRDRAVGSPVASLPEPIAEVAIKRFLDAIEALDPEEAQRVTAAAAVAFPAYELASKVVAPILKELGDRWQAGRFSVAQEHAASAVIRGVLGDLLRTARASDSAPSVVATTPQGELHEFGAMLAGIAASSVGARVLYLGPNTPPDELASAVRGARAKAAIVSIVAMDPRAAHDALTAIRRSLPKSVAVWAGGGGLVKPPPANVIWTRTLDDVRARTVELTSRS